MYTNWFLKKSVTNDLFIFFYFQLECAYDQIITPLEKFRKEKIGQVKEGKKKFEKQTAKFCQSQERYLSLSTKKQDSHLKEVTYLFVHLPK